MTRRLIYSLIGLRLLIDLAIAIVIGRQTGTWITGAAMWAVCWPFYLLLFFGWRSGTFHGTYGRKVHYWREPAVWWVVFGVILLFHSAVTFAFAWNVIDWPALFALTGRSGL